MQLFIYVILIPSILWTIAFYLSRNSRNATAWVFIVGIVLYCLYMWEMVEFLKDGLI